MPWLVFVVCGTITARLLSAAEHSTNLGFGVLLFFVLFEGGFLSATMLFAEPVLQALAWKAVLLGNLFAVLAMESYLWYRHPQMVMYP